MLSKCKFCNSTIEWIDMNGDTIPIDSRARTYQWDDSHESPQEHRWKKAVAYADHRDVCHAKYLEVGQ